MHSLSIKDHVEKILKEAKSSQPASKKVSIFSNHTPQRTEPIKMISNVRANGGGGTQEGNQAPPKPIRRIPMVASHPEMKKVRLENGEPKGVVRPDYGIKIEEEESKTTKPNDAAMEVESPTGLPPPSKPKSQNTFKRDQVKTLLTVGFPEKISGEKTKYTKKSHRLVITYISDTNQKKQKTIFFGRKDHTPFIEHKDEALKRREMGKLRKCTDVFEPNFYELHLLNGNHDTLVDNYTAMIKFLSL